LDGCSLNELSARLNEERRIGHAAVTTDNGQEAVVCFGYTGDIRKTCEIFDGSSTTPTLPAEFTHRNGGLALFAEIPTTVGCDNDMRGKAEYLTATGWTALPDHPVKISHHTLVGLDNGLMLLLGGKNWDYAGAEQTGIWQLSFAWTRIGELSQPARSGSAIYINRSIYYFELFHSAVHRIDLDESENRLTAVEEIGTQPARYNLPILFETDNDYCRSSQSIIQLPEL
jgi:hypothetical protein